MGCLYPGSVAAFPLRSPVSQGAVLNQYRISVKFLLEQHGQVLFRMFFALPEQCTEASVKEMVYAQLAVLKHEWDVAVRDKKSTEVTHLKRRVDLALNLWNKVYRTNLTLDAI